MSKNLVIVESPSKAKTIKKYLGKDFEVESSFGHIVDLPKKGMGIDFDNNFQPNYIVPDDKKKVVQKLKELSSKAETVWLASDEDREGEAIAWHLARTLDLDENKSKRIVFHEITKNAILNAVENPRKIDLSLVNAQQARRILDRIVGFELSPVLWKKVKPGLSAGRVQSVAVKLIVEREKEIQDFTSTSQFKVKGEFINKDKQKLIAQLNKDFENEKQTQEFLENCSGKEFSVSAVDKKPFKKSPAAPFTTSTLQQEAARKLGYSVSRTMRLAQQLYEAGHITYMRTDSVNLSDLALQSSKDMIEKRFGSKYSKTRTYKSKQKGAQEAHEAIRPTQFEVLEPTSDSSQNKLYQLIWNRTVASQMADAEMERTTIKIQHDEVPYVFTAKGEVILFDGFLTLYQESSEDDEPKEESGIMPKVSVGETLQYTKITARERFSQHPPRYSEASLVKRMEDLGIGRPSTYAPTISTIINREYVEKKNLDPSTREVTEMVLATDSIQSTVLTENYGAEKNKLFPTDIGIVVNDFLQDHFSKIMDYNFTAKVEEDLDQIANGKENWNAVIDGFYTGFHKNVEEVTENAEKATGERLLGQHPKSKRNVYARIGRFGPMIQIGESTDEEKPLFASLLPHQNIQSITLEEALQLFNLPRDLGKFKGEEILANVGRFGPYVKYKDTFVSIPKELDVFSIGLEEATQLIDAKLREDAPIANFNGHDVTKGKGRFGPYIKWNNLFINVSKKYDFDNLSSTDINELIEDKIRKEKEKLIRTFEKEKITIQKGRYNKLYIVKGKKKKVFPSEQDPKTISIEEVLKILES